MHSIDEHSDEESKIFALRYIMVISHTYVNRQLNILDMIVGYDMSFLFTDEKPLFFFLYYLTIKSYALNTNTSLRDNSAFP